MVIREYALGEGRGTKKHNDHFEPKQNMHAFARELSRHRFGQGSGPCAGSGKNAGGRGTNDPKATMFVRDSSCCHCQAQVAAAGGQENCQESDLQERWPIGHSILVRNLAKAIATS